MDEKFKALKEYNFWDGNIPYLGIPRVAYTEKIFDFVGNKLVKVLVGQRRVGKSYILRQIAFRLMQENVPAQNILYINKEFIDFDFISDYKILHELVNLYEDTVKPQGKVYLFIDEIQGIEGWEHFVNSYSQNFTKNYEIFITGSNSKLLSGEMATLLSGRYVKFEIFPFSYQEYLQIKEVDNSKAEYMQYLQTGGLPELFILPNNDAKRNYISSIKDSVLLRDIIQRYNIKDTKLLEDIFVYLVNNASNLLSITNIVNFFSSRKRKTTYDTIANYIGFIEEAFLIHKAERYNIRGKETMSGTAKYYINDLSFKNFLYPGFAYGIGYELENLVFLALKRKGYAVYVGNDRGKEIDFVAIKEDRVIYIQSTYLLLEPQTIEREYAPLLSINDSYEKYVVSLDDVTFPSKEGVKHIQAWLLDDIL